jgi:hypothetical protein
MQVGVTGLNLNNLGKITEASYIKPQLFSHIISRDYNRPNPADKRAFAVCDVKRYHTSQLIKWQFIPVFTNRVCYRNRTSITDVEVIS